MDEAGGMVPVSELVRKGGMREEERGFIGMVRAYQALTMGRSFFGG